MVRSVLFALGLLFIIAHSAVGAQLDAERYDIYYGDVDGNNLTDVYFHGRERLIILHGDIATPIVLQAPVSFVLKQQFEGSFPNLTGPNYQLQTIDPPLADSVLANYRRLEAGRDVYAGDFNGDGKNDLLVLNDEQSTSGYPVILSGTDASTVLPVHEKSLFAATNPWLGDMRTSNVQIRDVTGDGRDDVVFLLQSDTYADFAHDLSTANESTAAKRIALTTPTAQPATLVGSTGGQLRVSESGAATYAINIATPAGTAGVAPQLALSYSSQGQNGLLGQGWSLSGLSAITRCRQTLTQDNNPKPIAWTSDDRFCLDGQRLMLVSGSHGAPGAVYKTEIESFTTVTAYGGSAGNPYHFVVEKKDGSVSFYGYGENSKEIASNGKTFAWAQSRYQDNVGNMIRYLYHADADNGFRLQAIYYAFGAEVPLYSAANAVITFSYEDRFDPRQGYFAGYLTGIKKRLSRIDVANAGQTVRTYHLDYMKYDPGAPVPDRTSRLAHVQECVGGQCLPATRFDWSVLPQLAFQSSTGNFSLSTAGDSKDYHAAWRLGDINGDGHMDVVIEREHEGSEHNYYYLEYRLSTNQGTALTDSPVNEYTWSVSLGERKKGSDRSPYKWSLIDYNNDGRTDVITWHESVSYFNVYLSQPDANGDWWLAQNPIAVAQGVNPDKHHVFVDFNGDGLLDAVSPSAYWLLERDPTQSEISTRPYRFGSANSLSWTGIAPPIESSCIPADDDSYRRYSGFGDFNGDGITDVIGTDVSYEYYNAKAGVCRSSTNTQEITYVLIRNGSNLENSVRVQSPGGIDVKADDLVKAPDINADGLPDLFFKAGGAYYYRLNTGNGFAPIKSFSTQGDNPRDFQLIDYNNDGYVDVVYVSGTGDHYVSFWSGDQFGAPYRYFYDWIDKNEEFALVDVSNDGRLDVLHLQGPLGDLRPSVLQAQANNVITDFTNGLGSTASITYEALNHSAHYQIVGESCPTGQLCYKTVDPNLLRRTLLDPNGSPDGPHSLGLQAPVMELHGPLYVATQVEGAMPSAGSTAGNVAQGVTSSIRYYYAEAYVQAGGRGFLGFKKLTTYEPQTETRTTTTYNLEFPYIGYPVSTEVRTPFGRLLRKANNNWRLHNWQSTWPAQVAAGGTKAIAPFQPYLETATETTWPTTTNLALGGKISVGSVPQQTVTTVSQYDDYGNATVITETTYGGGSTFITKTENTYGSLDGQVTAEANAWLQKMGRLSQSKVTHTRTVDGVTQTATRTARFTYYYYTGSANCFVGSPALAGMLCEEIIEPDDNDPATPNYQLTKTHIYDDLGNEVRVEQQGGGEATRTVRKEYDPHGRYVDRTYNSLGHLVEEVAQRNNLGLPAVVNTPNGVTATVTYDALGRKIYTSDTTGQWTQVTYTTCGACPTGATHAVEKHAAGGGKSIVYFDELARPIREGTVGFDGQWVYSDTEYDSLGRVQRKSEPFYQGQTTAYWIETEYDSLGRTIRTVLPDGSQGTTHYDGLATTITNDLGHKKTEIRNLKGELVKAIDHLNTPINYHYDAQGNLSKVIPNNDESLAISITYDVLGRKTAMDDPDKGDWEYAYNAFGELMYQKNANNHVTVQSYDLLGRLTARTDYRIHDPAQPANNVIDTHTRWYYDSLDDAGTPVANALGQVTAVVQSRSMSDEICYDATTDYCERYHYDAQGRPQITDIKLGRNGTDGRYRTRTEYDSIGRIAAQYDVLGGLWEDQTNGARSSGTINAYNSYGHLQQITDVATGDLLYRVEQTDARGHTTRERLANGITSIYTYNPKTGRLENQSANLGGVFAVQDITYRWDTIGNLTSRRNYSTNPWTNQREDRKESFCYDGLNRLTKTALGTDSYDCTSLTLDQQDLRYDPTGNITYKHDVGTYTYGQNGAGPHAVTHTSDGIDYFYDNNGNMTGDSNGRALHYTTFDKPDQISRGNHQIHFKYGPDRSRFERVDINTSTNKTTTTHYLGNIERIVESTVPNEVQWKRYLPGGAIYTVTTTRDANNQLVEQSTDKVVLYKDHLGSSDVMTDVTGNVIHAMSFDPWGQRRDSWTWANLSPADLVAYSEQLSADLNQSATTRGFTGHEMLDEVGLIHMNGRVYDPRLARFLQADPIVQAASDTQLFNRYSYTRNNPLNATDPSGYLITAVVSAIAYALYAAGVITEFITVAAIVAAASAIEVLANGGDIGQALVAAFTSFAMSMIGSSAFPTNGFGFNVSTAQFVGTMAVIGGISSTLNGGSFGSGFRAAGLGAMLGGAISKNAKFGQTLGKGGRAFARITVGGTLSKLSGGKFANGAATAAFTSLMGEATGKSENKQGSETKVTKEEAKANFNKAKAQILKDLKSGALDIGLSEEYIVGGYDAVEFELVADIDGAMANVNYTDLGYGPVEDVTITVDYAGASTLGEAFDSIGHEFRHLTVDNRELSGIDPDGPGPLYSPRERDAQAWGGIIRRHYGH